MPTPKPGEKEDEFMERCIPMMMDEGMPNKQAVATCMNMFKEKKGFFHLKALSLDEKREHITRAFQEMFYPVSNPNMPMVHGWIADVYDIDGYLICEEGGKYYRVEFTEDGEKYTFAARAEWVEVESKRDWVEKVKSLKISLFRFGNSNALKAISKTDNELRVANYIVLFGGRDLEWLRSGPNPDGSKGEYFTEKTIFDSSYTKTGAFHVDWEHGVGKALDGDDAPGPDDVLGIVDWKTATKDEKGIWVERALSRRNEYVQLLEELGIIEDGLLGTSSQAIETGIKRGKNGEIKAWPLKMDCLTFWPAESRMITANYVTKIKALGEHFPHLKAILPTILEKDAINRLQLQAQAYIEFGD